MMKIETERMTLHLIVSEMDLLRRLSHTTGQNRTQLVREALKDLFTKYGVKSEIKIRKRPIKRLVRGIQHHVSYYMNMSLDELLR